MFEKLFVRRDLRRILEEVPDAQDALRAASREDLIAFHRTLGRYIRNGFREGRYPALQTYCHRRFGADYAEYEHLSFDALSSIAIEKMWELVQKESGTLPRK
jgi:hypothetical protein